MGLSIVATDNTTPAFEVGMTMEGDLSRCGGTEKEDDIHPENVRELRFMASSRLRSSQSVPLVRKVMLSRTASE